MLARLIAGLGDVAGVGLPEQPDTPDVIDMSLGRDDVRRGAGTHGVEDTLVVGGLVAHPGVHDDPARPGDEHVRRRRPTRAVEEVGQAVGGVVVDGCEQLLARPVVDEPIDAVGVHVTSTCTATASW